MLVQSFLEESARLRPGKVALVDGPRRFTYADIDRQANRLADALAAHGVRRGDRVVVWLPNCAEAVVSIFAILKAGAVFVVLNRATKEDKLAYILDDSGAVGLIGEAGQLEETRAGGSWRDRCRALRVLVQVEDASAPPGRADTLAWSAIQCGVDVPAPPPAGIDLDLACLVYTSGTTGESKGVMSDHASVAFASWSITSYLRNTDSDVILVTLPLSFDYGLYQVLMAFRFGGTVVLERSFAYPAAMLARIAEERVTGFPCVPTIVAMLLTLDLTDYDLSSLRYITNTAAALPPSHVAALRAKLPDVALYSMYGLTETKRTLYLPPELIEAKPGSVGIAIPGTEVWLEDEHGVRLPHGSEGELVVRGRHVMRGYWNAPEFTARRFAPGPLPGERVCRSGDLFRSDGEGFLYFLGRRDDLIKSRGEKVYPKEVETVLCSLPGVVEAAVIGVPDTLLGQAIKAVIVRATPTLTVPAVMAHCRAGLEDWMVPRHVEFRDSLPRSASGKVRKEELA